MQVVPAANQSAERHRMSSEFDVAVVGGGLVGMAIAYGLVRTGRRVVVLDEGDIAWRASRGNFGLVWVQGKGKGLPAYSSWTQRSARLWPTFARLLKEDTDIDVSFEQPGGFQLCLTPREMELRAESLSALMAQPGFERYDYDLLDRDALKQFYPGIGPDVVGGSYSRLDGHVNPLKLFRALHAAFQAHGGTYRPEWKVEKVLRTGAVGLLQGPAGCVNASQIVLAAGLDNRRLASAIGLEVPVRPQRGQIIVLERMRRFMEYPVVTLRQTDEGTVLIGDSVEEGSLDDGVGFGILSTLADRAIRMFPALRDARVVRSWGALRIMSADGFPVYEQSNVMPGVFVATCHSGVTLAAVHALELAPQLVQGSLSASLRPFSLERFQNVQETAAV
jgi:hydrogen cyanide synthase HcnC